MRLLQLIKSRLALAPSSSSFYFCLARSFNHIQEKVPGQFSVCVCESMICHKCVWTHTDTKKCHRLFSMFHAKM